MSLYVVVEILYSLFDTKSSNGIESACKQKWQVGSLCIRQLQASEQESASIALRDEVIEESGPALHAVTHGVNRKRKRYRRRRFTEGMV